MLRIPVRGPFAVDAAVAALAAHAVPGAERVDRARRCVRRLLPLADGPAEVSVQLAADHVAVSGEVGGAADEVAALVRHWLGLDADTARIDAVLAADPLLGPLVAARPGLRVVSWADGFEGAVSTVLGQQVSVAAGRTFAARLLAEYGEPQPGGLVAFPAPEVLAAAPLAELRTAVGVPRSRARTVQALAAAVADGLPLRPGAAVRGELLALPGVGPWTVEHLALRVFGDGDAFPSGDLVLRRALGAESAAAAVERARGWSPHRAHAVFHLWTATAYGLR